MLLHWHKSHLVTPFLKQDSKCERNLLAVNNISRLHTVKSLGSDTYMTCLVAAQTIFISTVTFSKALLHNNEGERAQGYVACPDIQCAGLTFSSSGTGESRQMIKAAALIDSLLLNSCTTKAISYSEHFSFLYKG